MASAILGLSLPLLTACGGESNASDNRPIPRTETTASPTANVGAFSPSVSSPDQKLMAAQKLNEPARIESTKLLKAAGIEVTDTIRMSPKGNYPLLLVENDSKYARFNPDGNTGGLPEGWTNSTAGQAQLFGMNHMLQEVLDSPVTDSGDDVELALDEWKERNAEKFHPQVVEEFMNQSAEEIAFNPEWIEYDEFVAVNYSYLYDEISPRVRSLNLTSEGSQEYLGGIYYKFAGTFSMNAKNNNRHGIVEDIDLSLSYTVSKIDGEFVITGSQINYETDVDKLFSLLDHQSENSGVF